MDTTGNKKVEAESVTVTREQFNKMMLALSLHIHECRQDAEECRRLGLEKLQEQWRRDAIEMQAVYNQVCSL